MDCASGDSREKKMGKRVQKGTKGENRRRERGWKEGGRRKGTRERGEKMGGEGLLRRREGGVLVRKKEGEGGAWECVEKKRCVGVF